MKSASCQQKTLPVMHLNKYSLELILCSSKGRDEDFLERMSNKEREDLSSISWVREAVDLHVETTKQINNRVLLLFDNLPAYSQPKTEGGK